MGGDMAAHAATIGTMLELVAGDVIRELEDVPEELLNRNVEVPEANSLYAIATHLMASGESWTLGAVGGQELERDRDSEFVATGRFADLRARHDAWMVALHELLDGMPDAELDRSTGVPPYRADLEQMTVEHALLHALDHVSIHLGHIQVTKQFLLAGRI